MVCSRLNPLSGLAVGAGEGVCGVCVWGGEVINWMCGPEGETFHTGAGILSRGCFLTQSLDNLDGALTVEGAPVQARLANSVRLGALDIMPSHRRTRVMQCVQSGRSEMVPPRVIFLSRALRVGGGSRCRGTLNCTSKGPCAGRARARRNAEQKDLC